MVIDILKSLANRGHHEHLQPRHSGCRQEAAVQMEAMLRDQDDEDTKNKKDQGEPKSGDE